MSKRRTIVVWMTLGVLAADLAQEALRLVVCGMADPRALPVVCIAPAGTVGTVAAKIKALAALWNLPAGGASLPSVSPGETHSESPIDRVRAREGL